MAKAKAKSKAKQEDLVSLDTDLDLLDDLIDPPGDNQDKSVDIEEVKPTSKTKTKSKTTRKKTTKKSKTTAKSKKEEPQPEEEDIPEEEQGLTAEQIMEQASEDEEDDWVLIGPPTLNDPTSVRDPVDLLTSFRDEKGKTIVTDKLLGALKKRFTAISEIATLPTTEELTKLSGIGEQTANKIWKIAQQYHHLNAKTAKDMLKKKGNILYCSTGSQALDELLQGGIATRAITEFFGEAGMGKTQICYTASVFALLQKKEGGFMDYDPKSKQRPRVHWLDTEATFNPERIVEIVKTRFPNKDPDEFLDNIVVHQVISTDKLIDTLKDVFQSPDNIVLIIIDSILALFRFEYSHGVSELARRQQKIQQVLGVIKRNMMIKNCAFLISNQATTKMTMAGPISLTEVKAAGGFAVAHAVTHRIKLTKKSAGKNKGIVLRKATVIDSPYIPAGEAEFVLAPEGVIDFVKSSSRAKKTAKVTQIDEFETEDDIEDDILV